MRQRPFFRDASTSHVEQPRPIRDVGLGQFLLRLLDKMREVDGGRGLVGAATHVFQRHGGHPEVAERARQRAREAWRVRNRGQH